MRAGLVNTAAYAGMAAACALFASSGCAQPTRASKPRPVALSEFARPQEDSGSDDPLEDDTTALAGALDDQAEPPVIEDVWFDELDERLQPTEPGDTVIVDSLVGHINGRPVFADEFLAPIEDRLLREAETSRGLELEVKFTEIINEWLREVLQNELILAEAQASLSEQEQMGLFAWLRSMYDEEVRKGGGTRSGAEKRRIQEGEELDQYLASRKDMVLIDQLQRQKIDPRISVTWRDVQREYKRRYEEFNPPATVTLALIRLTTASQGAEIDAVNTRLAAGEPFSRIAEDLGFENDGIWETFRMGPGGVTDIEVRDQMKTALEGLGVGDTTVPFTMGSSTMWLHVVEISQPPSRSIYDPQVQLGLQNLLRARRLNQEWTRYVNSLLEEGVTDDLDAMAQQLYRIALTRYAGYGR